MSTNVTSRESNIEILRIVLMTMIVFGHTILHGLHDSGLADKIGPLYIYHVDCFIFISGFFGITFKIEKFCLLLFKIFFYGIISILIRHYILGTYLPYGDTWRCIFPFSNNGLWFMSNYLFLMILSPFLNIGAKSIDKKLFFALIICLFSFVASGFTLMDSVGGDTAPYRLSPLFILIYLVGRYLHNYPIRIFRNFKFCIFLYICGITSLYLMKILLVSTYCYDVIMRYNNPIIILTSISFFYIFKNLKVKSVRAVNIIASGVLAAYIISDTNFTRGMLESYIIKCVGTNPFMLLLGAFTFVVIMGGIDYIVSNCYKRALDLCKKYS